MIEPISAGNNSSIDLLGEKESEHVPGGYQTQELRELKDLYPNFHQSLIKDCWVGRWG